MNTPNAPDLGAAVLALSPEDRTAVLLWLASSAEHSPALQAALDALPPAGRGPGMSAPKPLHGALVLDFQGPFKPEPKLLDDYGDPFVVVQLFSDPHVGLYITSDDDADVLIAAITKAKQMRRKAARS